MSSRPSLLDLKSFSLAKMDQLFSLTKELKSTQTPWQERRGKTIALLFFEASTRTRLSFETAAYRVGLGPLLLDGSVKSSIEKGESIEDSILNVAAMEPTFLVIRCGDNVDLAQIAQKVSAPVINAGWGVCGHPTQALLDAFTMHQHFGDLKNKKILFVGDIRHSRVVASHLELAPLLQTELAICCPSEFFPPLQTPQHSSLRDFASLAEGLQWADVVIALRCQFERHQLGSKNFSAEDYRKKYGLNPTQLRQLKSTGLVLHPGPVNHGIELESEVLQDPRCRILEQVTNGVYIREALLRLLLEEKE